MKKLFEKVNFEKKVSRQQQKSKKIIVMFVYVLLADN